MIQITKIDGPVVEAKAGGDIRHEDYVKVLPELERAAAGGALRCLVEMERVTSIEPRAIADDLKFDVKHAKDFQRVALVSGSKIEGALLKVWALLLPHAEVRRFEPSQREAAAAWVRE